MSNAYREGENAFERSDGRELDAWRNPYDWNTYEYYDFKKGYEDARSHWKLIVMDDDDD